MAVTASALTNTISQPGVFLTDNYPDLLNEQFNDITFRQWAMPLQGLELYNVEDTNKDNIHHSYVFGLGLMTQNSDEDNLPIDHAGQGYDNTITPVDYRLSVRITEKLRETDQYGAIRKIQSRLGMSASQTVEYLCALPFNTGFGSNAQWLTADGLYLFDDGRNPEYPGEATWGNLETASELTQSSLSTMRINFRKTVNERGLPSPIVMKKLIVPPDLEDRAEELINSKLRPEDSMNATNVNSGRFEIKVWDYLTDTNAWFGCGPMNDLHELFFVWRIRPSTKTFPLGDNPDVIVHRVRMSCETGADRPHNIRGNAGPS